MSETEYGDRLWRKALRCGNVFSDSRLKSLFAEGLLPAIRTQVRHHLTTQPRIAFTKLTRYAEGMGTAYRGGKNYPAAVGGRDRSGHRTGCQKRSLLLSEESSEPGFLEEVDVSSDSLLAMAVETAAFPSPLGSRSTYVTASPGSTVQRVGDSAWQTPNIPPRGGDVRYWEPPRQDASGGTSCRLCLSREDLAAMGCRRTSELGFWPNGRRTSNRDVPRGIKAWGSDSKRPKGESVTEFPETLLSGDPAWDPVRRTGRAFQRRPRKKVGKRQGGIVEASASPKPSLVQRGAPPTRRTQWNRRKGKSCGNNVAGDPACVLSRENYKLGLSVGCRPKVMFPISGVLDTGAGPNIIHERILPSDWTEHAAKTLTRE